MPRFVDVSPADVSLFHVAAREVGDALLAWRLAFASGWTDPWIMTVGVVTIPDGPAPQNDGLPPY